MPSIKKIKFFKQVAILLSIIWTLATYFFFTYQMSNENTHILNNTISKANISTKQAEKLIAWSFEQKLKSMKNNEKKQDFSTDFSLRDLIHTMSQEDGFTINIEGNYLDDDFSGINQSIMSSIKKSQKTKKDSYITYDKNETVYLFYIKPLLASNNCIKCHVHDDKKVGDLLGNVNINIKIKTLKEYNRNNFYFLFFTYLSTWIAGLVLIWWIRYKSRKYFDEKIKNYEEGIYSLVDMMERRDRYTAGHSKRVAHYSSLIAEELEICDDDCNLIFRAGMLHDIGKIEVPDAVLLKPDLLAKDEYELIKTHSKVGFDLLSRDPFYDLASIVLHHHENFDGTGYPYGLTGSQIPFLSQIISVADVYDAVTTSRAYRKAMSKEEAIEILKNGKDNKFNPVIVEAALKVFNKMDLDKEVSYNSKDMIKEMKFSYYFKDPLTDCYNINYVKFLLTHKDNYKMICAHHINFLNFTGYNEKYGWQEGDKFLKHITSIITSKYEDSVLVRVSGDNFIILNFDKHLDIDISMFNHIEISHNLKAEFKHVNLLEEGIDSFDKLEDIILSKH